MNGGQQRFDVLGGEVAINRADAAAGTSVLVLQPDAHGFVECGAVHAVERAAKHSVVLIE